MSSNEAGSSCPIGSAGLLAQAEIKSMYPTSVIPELLRESEKHLKSIQSHRDRINQQISSLEEEKSDKLFEDTLPAAAATFINDHCTRLFSDVKARMPTMVHADFKGITELNQSLGKDNGIQNLYDILVKHGIGTMTPDPEDDTNPAQLLAYVSEIISLSGGDENVHSDPFVKLCQVYSSYFKENSQTKRLWLEAGVWEAYLDPSKRTIMWAVFRALYIMFYCSISNVIDIMQPRESDLNPEAAQEGEQEEEEGDDQGIPEDVNIFGDQSDDEKEEEDHTDAVDKDIQVEHFADTKLMCNDERSKCIHSLLCHAVFTVFHVLACSVDEPNLNLAAYQLLSEEKKRTERHLDVTGTIRDIELPKDDMSVGFPQLIAIISTRVDITFFIHQLRCTIIMPLQEFQDLDMLDLMCMILQKQGHNLEERIQPHCFPAVLFWVSRVLGHSSAVHAIPEEPDEEKQDEQDKNEDEEYMKSSASVPNYIEVYSDRKQMRKRKAEKISINPLQNPESLMKITRVANGICIRVNDYMRSMFDKPKKKKKIVHVVQKKAGVEYPSLTPKCVSALLWLYKNEESIALVKSNLNAKYLDEKEDLFKTYGCQLLELNESKKPVVARITKQQVEYCINRANELLGAYREFLVLHKAELEKDESVLEWDRGFSKTLHGAITVECDGYESEEFRDADSDGEDFQVGK
eukprot:3937466-Rhodomonas_salina.1